MSEKSTRDIIIEAADELFYERGFESTSFADIAEIVKISRGNFYYHFKTKDDILEAVIEYRLAVRKVLLERWEDEAEGPAERIRRFINILIMNQVKIMRSGCPVGSLCSELAKIDHPLLGEANRLLSLFRDWLRKQFQALGRTADADELAMHVLMRSQGVATLANAFHDENFIKQEVEHMCVWLEEYIPDEEKC